MKRPFLPLVAVLLAGLSALAGCTSVSLAPQPPAPGTASLTLACPVDKAAVPNAEYIGPYMGIENGVPVREMAQDIHCSDQFKAARFPAGFVTLYGSSRIRENNPACDARGQNCNEALKAANDAVYAQVRRFARAWTERYGARMPVMTGAGPGLMEAANRGAREAGGASVGYTTYYDRASSPTVQRPYGGDPRQALNPHITHGLIFSSIAIREAAMIKHSAAMVIAPGGTGTEWEAYQIIETLKSRQLAPVPVYLLGNRAVHWASLEARLRDMAARRTITMEEVSFLRFVDSGDDLVRLLAADLRLD